MGKPITDPRKCKKHNAWKHHIKRHKELGAICELCQMELDAIRKGTVENKPEVVIKKMGKLGTGDQG